MVGEKSKEYFMKHEKDISFQFYCLQTRFHRVNYTVCLCICSHRLWAPGPDWVAATVYDLKSLIYLLSDSSWKKYAAQQIITPATTAAIATTPATTATITSPWWVRAIKEYIKVKAINLAQVVKTIMLEVQGIVRLVVLFLKVRLRLYWLTTH